MFIDIPCFYDSFTVSIQLTVKLKQLAHHLFIKEKVTDTLKENQTQMFDYDYYYYSATY